MPESCHTKPAIRNTILIAMGSWEQPYLRAEIGQNFVPNFVDGIFISQPKVLLLIKIAGL